MVLKQAMRSEKGREVLRQLYGENAKGVEARYESMEKKFFSYFGEGEYRIFSAPGRTEIGGNHTDHQYGRVLAAAVSVDTLGFVRPNGTSVVRYRSEGYRGESEFRVDLADLSVNESEKGTTNALVRGAAAMMKQEGYNIGGFDVYVASTVLRGSGLSSSAAFEVFLVAVMDGLFNKGDMSPILRAQICQWTENRYFGKPSGLMDQMASSVGALVTIDFADIEAPVVEKVDFDFMATDYQLVVVDTGGNHANLTDEYAYIVDDMASVSRFFGVEKLRQVDENAFIQNLPALKGKVSDRAILRTMHFFGDNARVVREVNALKQGDLKSFLNMVVDSGESSWKLLQNLYASGSPEQGIPLALAVSEHLLKDHGAWRVHGGGFAGTIQAFVPNALLRDYVGMMDAIFHEGAATVLSIRPVGACEVVF